MRTGAVQVQNGTLLFLNVVPFEDGLNIFHVLIVVIFVITGIQHIEDGEDRHFHRNGRKINGTVLLGRNIQHRGEILHVIDFVVHGGDQQQRRSAAGENGHNLRQSDGRFSAVGNDNGKLVLGGTVGRKDTFALQMHDLNVLVDALHIEFEDVGHRQVG